MEDVTLIPEICAHDARGAIDEAAAAGRGYFFGL